MARHPLGLPSRVVQSRFSSELGSAGIVGKLAIQQQTVEVPGEKVADRMKQHVARRW